MELLMIIVAGSWAYACACALAKDVSSLGLNKSSRMALFLSLIVLTVYLALLFYGHL